MSNAYAHALGVRLATWCKDCQKRSLNVPKNTRRGRMASLALKAAPIAGKLVAFLLFILSIACFVVAKLIDLYKFAVVTGQANPNYKPFRY